MSGNVNSSSSSSSSSFGSSSVNVPIHVQKPPSPIVRDLGSQIRTTLVKYGLGEETISNLEEQQIQQQSQVDELKEICTVFLNPTIDNPIFKAMATMISDQKKEIIDQVKMMIKEEMQIGVSRNIMQWEEKMTDKFQSFSTSVSELLIRLSDDEKKIRTDLNTSFVVLDKKLQEVIQSQISALAPNIEENQEKWDQVNDKLLYLSRYTTSLNQRLVNMIDNVNEIKKNTIDKTKITKILHGLFETTSIEEEEFPEALPPPSETKHQKNDEDQQDEMKELLESNAKKLREEESKLRKMIDSSDEDDEYLDDEDINDTSTEEDNDDEGEEEYLGIDEKNQEKKVNDQLGESPTKSLIRKRNVNSDSYYDFRPNIKNTDVYSPGSSSRKKRKRAHSFGDTHIQSFKAIKSDPENPFAQFSIKRPVSIRSLPLEQQAQYFIERKKYKDNIEFHIFAKQLIQNHQKHLMT